MTNIKQARFLGGMKHAQILLGPKEAGKSELAKRNQEGITKEEDYESTVGFIFWPIKLENFAGVNGNIMYNERDHLIAVDTAGQEDITNDKSLVRRLLPLGNLGVVYVASAIDKESLHAIKEYDKVLKDTLESLKSQIPHRTLFISKACMDDSYIKLEQIFNGINESLSNVLKLCSELNISSLIVGDSKGINFSGRVNRSSIEEQIKKDAGRNLSNEELYEKLLNPRYWLTMNRGMVFEKPIEVRASTPFSINVLNKIYDEVIRARRNRRNQDKGLIDEYKSAGIF